MDPTPRLTIFGIPKPFRGHSAVIQENALRSWSRLPNVEVILFGQDDGVDEAAARYGAAHEPDIHYSNLGTPLLSSVFERAARVSTAPILCYLNADIMIFDDFLAALRQVRLQRALVVARRRNLEVGESLQLTNDAERELFLNRARREAVLESPFGSDVFAFNREIDWSFPPFAVGRPAWDNWLMYRALEMKIPLVDVTADALVLHQNHDYGHVPRGVGNLWEGPEANENRALLGGSDHVASLLDTTYVLVDGRLQRPRGWDYQRARILMWGKRSQIANRVLTLARPIFRFLKMQIPRQRLSKR